MYPASTTKISEIFMAELREKHRVDDAFLLVNGSHGSNPPVTLTARDSATKHTRNATASNVSFEK
jgi:hypothetical protein